jgi:hypothetical protein
MMRRWILICLRSAWTATRVVEWPCQRSHKFSYRMQTCVVPSSAAPTCPCYKWWSAPAFYQTLHELRPTVTYPLTANSVFFVHSRRHRDNCLSAIWVCRLLVFPGREVTFNVTGVISSNVISGEEGALHKRDPCGLQQRQVPFQESAKTMRYRTFSHFRTQNRGQKLNAFHFRTNYLRAARRLNLLHQLSRSPAYSGAERLIMQNLELQQAERGHTIRMARCPRTGDVRDPVQHERAAAVALDCQTRVLSALSDGCRNKYRAGTNQQLAAGTYRQTCAASPARCALGGHKRPLCVLHRMSVAMFAVMDHQTSVCHAHAGR